MKNRAPFACDRQIVATLWRQLCNNRLRNWHLAIPREVYWQ